MNPDPAMDDREAAWFAVHEGLPARWHVGPPTYAGDLDDRLTGVPKPDGGRMDELRRRLRLAYLDGAEE